MKDSSPKPSKEERKKLLIEMMQEDEKNGMYERTAEEILKKYFGGSIGETKVYITDKDLLLAAMEEYRSLPAVESKNK